MMAFANANASPPTVIDDDIHRTVDNLLKASATATTATTATATTTTSSNDNDNTVAAVSTQQQVGQQSPLGTEVYSCLLESLAVAMQKERNGWKDKLHTTLQVGG